MSLFDSAFAIVVGEEGNYVNDPNDPGGETKFGISKRSYPNLDIRQLTLDQAKAIYERDYWRALSCDQLPWDIALLTFDAAVNQGPGFAHSLTGRDVDLAVERALRYAQNENFSRYGKGWFRRLFSVFKSAQVAP